MRFSIAALLTKRALAISCAPKPHRMFKIRASCASSLSLPWQQENIMRNCSSRTVCAANASSTSGVSVHSVSSRRPISGAKRRAVRSRRTMSSARFLAVVISQAEGFSGSPSTSQTSSAREKASCTTSSASAKLCTPNRRVSAATRRPDSRRKIRALASMWTRSGSPRVAQHEVSGWIRLCLQQLQRHAPGNAIDQRAPTAQDERPHDELILVDQAVFGQLRHERAAAEDDHVFAGRLFVRAQLGRIEPGKESRILPAELALTGRKHPFCRAIDPARHRAQRLRASSVGVRIAGRVGFALGVWPEALERVVGAPPEQHGVEIAHACRPGLVDRLVGDRPIQIAVRARKVAVRGDAVEHHDAPHAASPAEGDMPIGRTSTEPPPIAIGQPVASRAACVRSRASTIMNPSTKSLASAYGPSLITGFGPRTTLPASASGCPGSFRWPLASNSRIHVSHTSKLFFARSGLPMASCCSVAPLLNKKTNSLIVALLVNVGDSDAVDVWGGRQRTFFASKLWCVADGR